MTRHGVLQEIVRLVDHDAVWKAGLAPHHVERGQHGADVFDLLIVRPMRQVDYHASIRIPQRAKQLSRRWWRILATEHGNTRQRLERPVVAFRIDDADAIAVQDQLLTEKAGDPGLARLRIAGHQHIAPAHRERELTSIFGIAEQQAPPGPRRNGKLTAVRDRAQVAGDGRWP